MNVIIKRKVQKGVQKGVQKKGRQGQQCCVSSRVSSSLSCCCCCSSSFSSKNGGNVKRNRNRSNINGGRVTIRRRKCCRLRVKSKRGGDGASIAGKCEEQRGRSRSVAIIGAGLAGVATAHALFDTVRNHVVELERKGEELSDDSRGVQFVRCVVYEASGRIASGASGAAAGLLHPLAPGQVKINSDNLRGDQTKKIKLLKLGVEGVKATRAKVRAAEEAFRRRGQPDEASKVANYNGILKLRAATLPSRSNTTDAVADTERNEETSNDRLECINSRILEELKPYSGCEKDGIHVLSIQKHSQVAEELRKNIQALSVSKGQTSEEVSDLFMDSSPRNVDEQPDKDIAVYMSSEYLSATVNTVPYLNGLWLDALDIVEELNASLTSCETRQFNLELRHEVIDDLSLLRQAYDDVVIATGSAMSSLMQNFNHNDPATLDIDKSLQNIANELTLCLGHVIEYGYDNHEDKSCAWTGPSILNVSKGEYIAAHSNGQLLSYGATKVWNTSMREYLSKCSLHVSNKDEKHFSALTGMRLDELHESTCRKDDVGNSNQELVEDMASRALKNIEGSTEPQTSSYRLEAIRCGVRAIPPRHKIHNTTLPILARLGTRESCIGASTWVLVGLGSRGVVYHSLFGDRLARAILDDEESDDLIMDLTESMLQ